jgi:GTP:adenosylcobinamide-phosphate guanylyltransferase
MFDAVVLAGTGKPDPLTINEGVSNKAFIKINNRFLLTYVLDALSASTSVNQVSVVGPEKELNELKNSGYSIRVIPERGTMLDNLAAGFNDVDQNRLCLVVTGDIPLIRAGVIERFLELCAPHDHDFYYPVLTRELCLKEFPQTERTYVRLMEGHLTGGNLGLCNPRWFFDNRSRLEMFISYRKKPLKLMRIFPPFFIVKYLFKKLSVNDAELFLSRLFSMKARAVFCDAVEIGIDVDKPSDLELVRSILTG